MILTAEVSNVIVYPNGGSGMSFTVVVLAVVLVVLLLECFMGPDSLVVALMTLVVSVGTLAAIIVNIAAIK